MTYSSGQIYGFLEHPGKATVPGIPTLSKSMPRKPFGLVQIRPDRLKILVIPPIQWMPDREKFCFGDGPNPHLLDTHLAEMGMDVDILDPHSSILNPFFNRGSFLQSLDPWRAIKILFAKRNYDLIISVFDGGALPLILLRKLALFKTPIALWDIGLTEGWPVREKALNYIVPRVSSIMVLGSKQVGYIRERWNTKARMFNVLHSVDSEFFSPAEDSGDYIFSIGNDHGRDYNTFIQALHDIKYPVKIRTNLPLPQSKEMGKNIAVLKERTEFPVLRTLYSSAKIVVLPLIETLNASGVSSILEASAMAKPMIVSENTAIADFVIPGETCLQVPCKNPEALNAAIKRLLNDPGLCRRLGQNARQLVEEKFSIKAFSMGFADSIRASLA